MGLIFESGRRRRNRATILTRTNDGANTKAAYLLFALPLMCESKNKHKITLSQIVGLVSAVADRLKLRLEFVVQRADATTTVVEWAKQFTIKYTAGQVYYNVYDKSTTNPQQIEIIDFEQKTRATCGLVDRRRYCQLSSTDGIIHLTVRLFCYLFIMPEGSTTQHHHYKDSRKAQETKN